MIFYRPLYLELIHALGLVFETQKPASKVIETVFKKNKKWGSRDRKVFAEAFYEIIKWKLWFSYLATNDVAASPEQLVVVYLGLNDFKADKLPEIKDSKVLSDLLSSVKKEKLNATQVPLNIKYSFPLELHEKAQHEIKDLESYYKQCQKVAPVFLRVNTQVNKSEQLLDKLSNEDIEVDESCFLEYGLKLTEKPNIFKTKAFKEGAFEVQDGGSQLIAPFMQLEPGQTVIDACAGAGGKTLHISNLLNNKGRVISLDIFEWKLNELKKRAKRNKAFNVEARLIEGQKTIKRLAGKADRLLLDVPCTGSGVFRRNPDSKYRWSKESFLKIEELQRELLENYASMLKADGKLIYATCSAFSSENEKQIEWFLEKNKDWVLEQEVKINVGENDFDAYYMARLSRSQ